MQQSVRKGREKRGQPPPSKCRQRRLARCPRRRTRAQPPSAAQTLRTRSSSQKEGRRAGCHHQRRCAPPQLPGSQEKGGRRSSFLARGDEESCPADSTLPAPSASECLRWREAQLIVGKRETNPNSSTQTIRDAAADPPAPGRRRCLRDGHRRSGEVERSAALAAKRARTLFGRFASAPPPLGTTTAGVTSSPPCQSPASPPPPERTAPSQRPAPRA